MSTHLATRVHSAIRSPITSSCRNPGGVRFGSAEIYDVLELCFSAHRAGLPAADAVVQDCLAVGQAIDGGADERVILFVQLAEGAALTPALEARIRAEIRQRRSARHVPARVSRTPVSISRGHAHPGLMVCARLFTSLCTASFGKRGRIATKILRAEVPYTLNGKRVEVPVKKVTWSTEVRSENGALKADVGGCSL